MCGATYEIRVFWETTYFHGCASFLANVQTLQPLEQIYNVEKAQNDWLLEIRFRFTSLDKTLYIIIIFSKPTDILWSPMSPYSNYRLNHCEILT